MGISIAGLIFFIIKSSCIIRFSVVDFGLGEDSFTFPLFSSGFRFTTIAAHHTGRRRNEMNTRNI